MRQGSLGPDGRVTFWESFENQRVVLPVIHVETEEQAVRNVRRARVAGADGVFLINHSIGYGTLIAIYEKVRAEFGDWWIGLNCLDLEPTDVFHEMPSSVDGVWVDNAGIDERNRNQVYANLIRERQKESGWRGLYFGGVDFKYQRRVEDRAEAARIAAGYLDVVTTSGPGTGEAADRVKIVALRSGAPDAPLAIASGITPENVERYVGLADCFLVATGISQSFTELDPDRVAALVQRVRSHGASTEGARTAGPAVCRDARARVRTVCFVCEWNEGRSPHLAYRVGDALRAQGSDIRTTSAGLSQGYGISHRRQQFLEDRGVSRESLARHRSTVFSEMHAESDLVLVAELPMKTRLLDRWPELAGRVMTIRGFARGLRPAEDVSVADAHIEDSGGHEPVETMELYEELERIAPEVADRLLES